MREIYIILAVAGWAWFVIAMGYVVVRCRNWT